MFRTLKPNYVLTLVPLPFRNITNKLFSLVKAFDPGLKVPGTAKIFPSRRLHLILQFLVNRKSLSSNRRTQLLFHGNWNKRTESSKVTK